LESKQHKHQKERIRDIARNDGYTAENEIPFWCWSGYHARLICYNADIFICSNREATAIIVEIDGYKGHSSEYQYGRDERRTEDIRNTWGSHIEVRRFTIAELEEATDDDIKDDLGIG
jgi:hypothetical protein